MTNVEVKSLDCVSDTAAMGDNTTRGPCNSGKENTIAAISFGDLKPEWEPDTVAFDRHQSEPLGNNNSICNKFGNQYKQVKFESLTSIDI